MKCWGELNERHDSRSISVFIIKGVLVVEDRPFIGDYLTKILINVAIFLMNWQNSWMKWGVWRKMRKFCHFLSTRWILVKYSPVGGCWRKTAAGLVGSEWLRNVNYASQFHFQHSFQLPPLLMFAIIHNSLPSTFQFLNQFFWQFVVFVQRANWGGQVVFSFCLLDYNWSRSSLSMKHGQ